MIERYEKNGDFQHPYAAAEHFKKKAIGFTGDLSYGVSHGYQKRPVNDPSTEPSHVCSSLSPITFSSPNHGILSFSGGWGRRKNPRTL